MEIETKVAESPIDQIKDFHRRGLYLQGYELATQEFGPLQSWTDTEKLLIGGRLAYNLGSTRLGRIMHRVAYQNEPENPEVAYFYHLSLSGRRSALQTWQDMQRVGDDLPNANDVNQSDWYSLRGCTLAILRDFEKAEHWFEKAIDLCPDRSWLYVCRTFLLEQQDRAEEALEVAERAFELQPWYRPAVQNLADRLVQMNRDEEALKLMREACERLESGDVQCQLGALCLETQRYEEAREIYDQVEKYFPLIHLDKKRPEWLAARRADTAYYCGDIPAAIEHAKKADNEFYTDLADKLGEQGFEGNRVILPVKFVRQNRLTCAPATLSALSEYWERPVEHLDVVDKICFDGTPAHSERNWAKNEGYITKEFRLTWESATALIDRGVPFTLATVDSGNGHLQAVIGYDSYRQSLIVRDPGERHFNEFQTKEMLKHYASCGPRGMVMVPQEKVSLLEGLEFPDGELYDQIHQVDDGLENHKRDEVAQLVDAMKQQSPDHRLTLRAMGSLASYDANVNELLSVSNSLLEQYPDDVNFLVTKLGCLGELGRREDRVQLLKAEIAKPKCDPMFWLRYAGELIDDAREVDNVRYYLHRGAKYRPHDPTSYEMLAGLALDRQDQEEALELYRFAACIGEVREGSPKAYFYASRMQNQTDTALKFLRDRFRRFGKSSSMPTRTLCWALEQVDQTQQAIDVLEKGNQLRADDGDLQLYTADFYGRYGKLEMASDYLKRAKGNCHKTDWLRAAALQNAYHGKLAESLDQWMQVIELEPLDSGAHRWAADLLADTRGPEEAIEHLKTYVERFPHSYVLRMSLIEWLRDEDPDQYEQQLDKFLELNPTDSWALRELAFYALKQRDFERAEQLASRAHEIEPNHPAVSFVRGRIDHAKNQNDPAKEHFRDAIRISIDYEFAIMGLMSCCDTKEERERELEFVYDELKKQVNTGDGLLTYRSYAAQSLDAEKLHQRLQEALDARPELWHAWSAAIRQLSDMQRHDEAVAKADEAVKRFPLLPRMWIDRAMAYAACGRIEGEIESLQKAKEINQNWGEPARLLSEAYEKKGDLESARAEIERVIAAEPRDVRNHGFLASLMWDQGHKQEAVDRIVKAVQMQPGYDWGWAALRNWSSQLKQHEKVIQITKKLTEDRPKSARSWLLYAESLGEREQIDDAVNALDQAIKLNPMNSEAYSQKGYQLTRAGKFDAALNAVRPKVFGDNVPIELKSREAWIEGERGNLETAIRKMEAVIKQDPDYFWAWHRLAEWYEFTEQPVKYHKASKEMARLEPQNPVSWGYLASAELQLDNRSAAKKHFLQAVQISPAYSYASSQLIDMQLVDKQYDDALATVELTSPHIGPAWTLSEKVRIESIRKNKEAAIENLEKLALTPAEDSTAMDTAVESLFIAGWGEEVMPRLDELLDHPDAQPGVAYVFVNLSATLKTWDKCQARLEEKHDNTQLWHEGAMKLLEEYSTGNEHGRLKKFIGKHKAEFQKDNKLWSAVGRAYNSAEMPSKTLAWMSDWKSREGVTSALLFPVVQACWHSKKDDEAMQAAMYIFQNKEPDESFGALITMIGFYELVYGSLESCVDAIGMVDPNYLTRFYQIVFQHIASILENLSTSGSYKDLSGQLKGIWAGLPEQANESQFLKRIHRLCQIRAAELHGKRIRAAMLKAKAMFS